MTETSTRRRFLRTAGVGSVGAVAGALAVGLTRTDGEAADGPNETDVGFCTDMSAHHAQALAMCERVLGRSTGDAVQAAAVEVLRNQSMEVGQMWAWLADWGQSTATPDTVMAWMGMGEGDGMPLAMMPGYATEEELRSLSLADGVDQGRLWLELMRSHHMGGVTMAEAAQSLTSTEKVVRLATAQAEMQTYEIEIYDWLLATEYA